MIFVIQLMKHLKDLKLSIKHHHIVQLNILKKFPIDEISSSYVTKSTFEDNTVNIVHPKKYDDKHEWRRRKTTTFH